MPASLIVKARTRCCQLSNVIRVAKSLPSNQYLDRDAGNPIAFATSAYETRFPQPSWAEQDPQDWWRVRGIEPAMRVPDCKAVIAMSDRPKAMSFLCPQAAGSACRAALKKANVAPDQIVAMAVDTTNCTVVALDDKGEVGGRKRESTGW